MKIYYSKLTGGFYNSDIHGENIPSDAVEITEATRIEMLSAERMGNVIIADAQGHPQAIDPKSILTIEEIKINKLEQLAAYRYARETAGITVNGEVIRTDRESQSMITNTLRGFDLKPEGTATDWETADGEWVQINKATLEAIGILVWDHVEACFQNKKRHSIAIRALTTSEEIAAYDFTTGWPE